MALYSISLAARLHLKGGGGCVARSQLNPRQMHILDDTGVFVGTFLYSTHLLFVVALSLLTDSTRTPCAERCLASQPSLKVAHTLPRQWPLNFSRRISETVRPRVQTRVICMRTRPVRPNVISQAASGIARPFIKCDRSGVRPRDLRDLCTTTKRHRVGVPHRARRDCWARSNCSGN